MTLQATISSSRVYSKLDEGFEQDYWHVYVTYTYDGVTYSDVYFDQARRAPEIGKAVTVQIDPEKPGELLRCHRYKQHSHLNSASVYKNERINIRKILCLNTI